MTGRKLALSLLAICLSGCICFQDTEYEAAQRLRAHYAWWFCDFEKCSCNPWSDYSSGWRRGYGDVLLGFDGEAPPVPPKRYWSHKYQSEAGLCAIDCWFAGYRDGADAALSVCGAQYHEVQSSPLFQQFKPNSLSPDRAPYDQGKTTVETRRVGTRQPKKAAPSDVPPPAAPVEYEDVEDKGTPADGEKMDSGVAPTDEKPSADVESIEGDSLVAPTGFFLEE